MEIPRTLTDTELTTFTLILLFLLDYFFLNSLLKKKRHADVIMPVYLSPK